MCSDSLKETRDKDSSRAAALRTAVFNQMLSQSAILCLNMQSRAASDSFKEARDKGFQPGGSSQNGGFPIRCSPKALFSLNYARPRVSESLKETRDKDSSLAAALKRWFCAKPCAFPSLSKRPGIRILAWRQLSKRWFSAKPCASDSLKETRDKGFQPGGSSKTVVLAKPADF